MRHERGESSGERFSSWANNPPLPGPLFPWYRFSVGSTRLACSVRRPHLFSVLPASCRQKETMRDRKTGRRDAGSTLERRHEVILNRYRRPRRTHGPVGGAPTGAAGAAVLPTLNTYFPWRQEKETSDRHTWRLSTGLFTPLVEGCSRSILADGSTVHFTLISLRGLRRLSQKLAWNGTCYSQKLE